MINSFDYYAILFKNKKTYPWKSLFLAFRYVSFCIFGLVLFCIPYQGQHFYFVKEVLKPYIFIKTDKDVHIKNKSVRVVRDFKMIETEQGRTITFSNKQGIKRIIIPN